MTRHTCQQCGREFISKNAQQRFCTISCADKNRSRLRPERIADHMANMEAARVRKYSARRQEIIGELEFLLGTDDQDNIARRLGYRSLNTLTKALHRWGREDLSERLRAEPVWHVPSGRIVDGLVVR